MRDRALNGEPDTAFMIIQPSLKEEAYPHERDMIRHMAMDCYRKEANEQWLLGKLPRKCGI